MQLMSLSGKFITEGYETADEQAKEGTRVMAQVRAITIQLEQEDVYAALEHAGSFHCLVEEWIDCEDPTPKPKEKWVFLNRKVEAKKHRTEWCCGSTQISMNEMRKKQQKNNMKNKEHVRDQSG